MIMIRRRLSSVHSGYRWRRRIRGFGPLVVTKDSSLRKRMRAMRRGIIPALPIKEKALLRHAWYRKKKLFDALRTQQENS